MMLSWFHQIREIARPRQFDELRRASAYLNGRQPELPFEVIRRYGCPYQKENLNDGRVAA